MAQSNVTMADHLKGHPLVEHGDIDDNVHPVESLRLVDALMKANKNFDMLLVPNSLTAKAEITLCISCGGVGTILFSTYWG